MITTAIKPNQPPQPVRFTVQDYHRLVELGFLGEDDHIELIRGELIQTAARGTAHEACITRLLRVLTFIIGDRATLQCQSPITIAFDGEPEPDFAIVKNREDDYESAYTRTVWLSESPDGYVVWCDRPADGRADPCPCSSFSLIDFYNTSSPAMVQAQPQCLSFR